ncbi:50S ribosomal protein L25/general stress protein Ctc [Methylophaga sp.]|uniref:50S ribosomal protein L25/general stress protein Ctc n=1 Tax=Methylophaga sp. TaxID=2024840 RepID=UPI00271685BA|nr:50S ribosomal protein L25/general stress protein Ctc [Methylophaga sp.]MDO8825706.1 50S ribosomal protein L25/general stress protein Ctc [Methylophaga sp.]
MENLFEVHAEARTDQGKGASRRLRRSGKVPAVVYGAEKEPVSVSVDHNQFIRHLAEEAFYAHILTLVIDGKKNQVVLKDLQRHPANDNKIIHADFLRVDANHAMTMTIPLHFINEEKAPGVKVGGLVSHLMTEVEISCLPKDLPEFIEVDIAKLAMDEAIHLSELKLPKGVTLTALTHTQEEHLEEGERSSYDQAVVSIHEPRVAKVDLDDTEADEDATEE